MIMTKAWFLGYLVIGTIIALMEDNNIINLWPLQDNIGMEPNFSKFSDLELSDKMSKRLLWLEAAYQEAAERADMVADNDRTGASAEIALEFKSIKYGLQQLHCKASILACKALNIPMVRGGER